MCTVSYVFTNGTSIITSNRDESTMRPNAIEPKNYLINNKNIIFPKDLKAGGTWFAVDEQGTVLVLLNGANEKHEFKFPYRKSRGLIVLDLISNTSPKDFWQEINLENIEPFTLILFQNNSLYQLRWNGIEKETTVLDINKNHVWSSSTLYSKEIRETRSNWFFDFIDSKTNLSSTEILHFHRNTENENTENGLVISRNNTLKTLSITQTIINFNLASIKHYDLITHKEFSETFKIIQN